MDTKAAFPVPGRDTARRLLEQTHGCTFDDFILAPQRSVIVRRDPTLIDLSCRLSRRITLNRPIVSANMDTVTRAPMAIVQAEEGGIGIIDRGFRPGEIGPQVREVEKVKRAQHGVIRDPYSVSPEASLDEAGAIMKRSRIGTLVVVDAARKLRGLLTHRDMRFVDRTAAARVSDRMTPVERLVVHRGPLTMDEAARVMVERKIKKLPLVDENGELTGLITARDIARHQQLPFATRDAHGRLMVGAAIGATGDFLERAAELIKAGVDVLVIDIAHGHSVVMERAMKAFRRQIGDFELIAGNVATAEGAQFLVDLGADGIKVGIGPGGGCTTRITTSFGVPQVQALVECRTAVAASGIGLITARDITRQRQLPFATRDRHGRLMVGAAIGATGDYLERATELVRAGVDVLVIDIAHGHSIVMQRALEAFRKAFPDTELIAGNVATAEGARFLLDLGADGIKVGIGPGGGCTTRITTSFGVPQVQALVECRLAVGDSGIGVIADGGIKRHGSLALALLFGGDCAMLGSAFAGTEEAPGEVVHKSVLIAESQKSVKVPFKVLRGMASLEAIRDRLDVEDADRVELEAIGAEGMEISVPARGSARTIVRDMIKHLCSSISYGGADSLRGLREQFWKDPSTFVIKQSGSARRESYDR